MFEDPARSARDLFGTGALSKALAAAAALALAHPKRVLAAWAIVAIATGMLGLDLDSRMSNDGLKVLGSESQRASAQLDERFPKLRGIPLQMLLVEEQPMTTPSKADPGRTYERFENKVVRTLSRLPYEGSLTIREPRFFTDRASAERTRATLMTLRLHSSTEDAQEAVASITPALRRLESPGLSIRVLGEPVIAKRYTEISRNDIRRAERLALVISAIVLLFAFSSVTAALLPVALAATTVLTTLGLLSLLSLTMPLSIVSVSTVSVLALGLGIDYSLFLVTRYREEILDNSRVDAVRNCMATTGRAIVLSGVGIAVSMLALLTLGLDEFSSMAVSAVIASGIAVATALTLLPALIVLLGSRLDRPTRRREGRQQAAAWQRLADTVTSRPLTALVTSASALVLLAVPALSVERRFHPLGDLPAHDSTVREVEAATKLYGPGAVAPIEVVTEDAKHVMRLLDADRNVSGTQVLAGDGRWRAVRALLERPPQDERSLQSIERLRERLDGRTAPAYVGGLSAAAVDLTDRIDARTPIAILAAMAAAFAVLSIGLQSLLIPLKAVVGTLLSVGAALGAMALALPDDPASGTGELLVPIILFAIVFGLSIDYEVFLLQRVRESVVSGSDTKAAVATALARSGRSITLAGICLAVVFAALAGSSLETFRQLGLGVAIAVVIDVTVVRCVLIPAATVLFGRWNWWFPSGLRRHRLSTERPAP